MEIVTVVGPHSNAQLIGSEPRICAGVVTARSVVTLPGEQVDQPVIEVDRATYERFEQHRQQTATDSVPEMDQSTFLDSLLDTQKAVREGYYDAE